MSGGKVLKIVYTESPTSNPYFYPGAHINENQTGFLGPSFHFDLVVSRDPESLDYSENPQGKK